MLNLEELLKDTNTPILKATVTLEGQKCFVYEEGDEIELVTTVKDVRHNNGLYYGTVIHADGYYESSVQWSFRHSCWM